MQRQEQGRKEPSEFNVIVKCKDLIKHTFTITNSTERFPKKYRFTLVNRIQDKAVDIYECALEANELNLNDAQEFKAEATSKGAYLLQRASIFHRAFARTRLYFFQQLRILVETCAGSKVYVSRVEEAGSCERVNRLGYILLRLIRRTPTTSATSIPMAR